MKRTFEIPEEVNKIILKYFPENSMAFNYFFTHSVHVTELALKVARNNPHLQADEEYLIRAGMLHDIGIVKTNAPEIGCFGDHPYIAHTWLGRDILEQEGMAEIAPICEKHIGVGITREDIVKNSLPLPLRDMVPETIDEKIICYADKFYSKSENHLTKPKPVEKIRKKISKYGEEKVKIFEGFVELFGVDYVY